MKKVVKIILVVVVLVFTLLFTRFYLIKYFPHEPIVISLPFSSENDDLWMINPMGETINHSKPQNPHGHAGIDFGWHYRAPLMAAVSGKVASIKIHQDGPQEGTTKDLEIVTGIYALRYREIDIVSNLKTGDQVNRGDLIGYAGKYVDPNGRASYSMHWEFDYDTPVFDRLCPLTYFDSESLIRINTIWEKAGYTHQGQFTEICSGDYKNRNK